MCISLVIKEEKLVEGNGLVYILMAIGMMLYLSVIKPFSYYNCSIRQSFGDVIIWKRLGRKDD